MSRRRGMTMIELLVVIGIIGLVLTIAVPVLTDARRTAYAVQCLSNMRQMQMAHYAYMTENNGYMIQANLPHPPNRDPYDPDLPPFTVTLREYGSAETLPRSPLDESPHWGPAPAGEPFPGAPDERRRITSYGINNFLIAVEDAFPNPGQYPDQRLPIRRYQQVRNPAATVHFMIMAFEGEYAASDHPHVESWATRRENFAPVRAGGQVQINAVSRDEPSWDSISNWGFLDGSARQLSFREVYRSDEDNNFNPAVAR